MSSEATNTLLSELLSDGADVHRCAAARALGKIGHPAAVDPLLNALLDEDPDVRAIVITGAIRSKFPSRIHASAMAKVSTIARRGSRLGPLPPAKY